MRLGLAFERLEDEKGCTAGGFHGLTPLQIYDSIRLVPMDTEHQRMAVAHYPTFSTSNEKNIQIFRVRRVEKTAEESFLVKRVSRL
jgi:hypothetical protein